MKESLRAQLDRMQNRLEELNAQLASEDIGKDIGLLKKLNQEHAETSEVLDTYALWKQAGADLEAARQMREEPGMREFADEEIADAETRLQAAQERIEYLLLPRDPDDARNAILEIRAGTGGDESALFAGDLLRMYLRYAEHRGWQTEILSASESELGGCHAQVLFHPVGTGVSDRGAVQEVDEEHQRDERHQPYRDLVDGGPLHRRVHDCCARHVTSSSSLSSFRSVAQRCAASVRVRG